MFDPDKLRWVNAHYLHHASGAQIAEWVKAAEPAKDGEEIEWISQLKKLTAFIDATSTGKLYEVVRGNITSLAELPSEISSLLEHKLEAEAAPVLVSEPARRVCGALAESVEKLAEWNAEAFKSALQSVGNGLGLKGKDLYQPVRVALTGRVHGPELPTVAAVLDRDECVRRLRAAAAGQSS